MNLVLYKYEERSFIEIGLNEGRNFTDIAKEINKDRTTIAKEVKKYRFRKNPGGFNNCILIKIYNLKTRLFKHCHILEAPSNSFLFSI